MHMSLKHDTTRTFAASLATAALVAPSALANDLRPADTGDATARVQQRGHAVTGGARAPDRLARDAATPAEPTTRPRDAPIVVEVTRAQGFDWTSAGIGAVGGVALVVIGVAAASTVSSRSRPAPP
jgi:hypothetical protein